jgi:predicted Zn-dependent protease
VTWASNPPHLPLKPHVVRTPKPIRVLLAVALAIGLSAQQGYTKTNKQQSQDQSGPNLIRDAEIEGLLRQYSRPIFKVARINPDAVRVFIIADDTINAFVAGGQRIFVNTGLFTKTKSYKEIIGVLAHESGHISGGHLAKMQNEVDSASTERIIGMLLGAAAAMGGSADGNTRGGPAAFPLVPALNGILRRPGRHQIPGGHWQ